MRRFQLVRHEDPSGISGTGVVAEGVEFTDGFVSLRWVCGPHYSTVMWDSIEGVEKVHGHGGSTEIRFIDS